MNENREKRLDKAKLKVLFNLPFFASGVASLPVVFSDRRPDGQPNPTATTNGEQILWNPEWFDSLKDEELVTVYCEEVGHCLLGHLWRKPSGAETERWNHACDIAVRGMMADFGEVLKSKGLADPFPFPDKNLLLNHSHYKDMCEEKVYTLLPSMMKQPKSGQSQGKGQPPPFGEFDNSPKSKEQKPGKDNVENRWKNAMVQAAHIAKSRGVLPAGIDRMINDMLNPQIPWQDVLRMHMRELCSDDWDWMKPDIALSDSSGFVMPSLHSERVGSVVFAIDTSGSIDQELLKAFKSEEQYCLDEMRPACLKEICCDSAIHQVKEYRVGEKIEGKAPGGGGTRFEPVFEHLEQDHVPPKCVVYMTDLQGSFPKEEPPYPVIWIVYGTEQEAPFGTTVRVK